MREFSPLLMLIVVTVLGGCDKGSSSTNSPPPTTGPNPAAAAGMNKFPYLVCDGGPHLLLPVDVASSWSGGTLMDLARDPKTDYGRACAATTNAEMAAIPVGSGLALVFASPPMSAWGISADGLVEVYDLQGWKTMDLDSLILRATASLATSSMADTAIRIHFVRPDAYLLAACDSPTATAYGVHQVAIAPGTYAVVKGSFTDAGGTVRVYRLRPAQPPR